MYVLFKELSLFSYLFLYLASISFINITCHETVKICYYTIESWLKKGEKNWVFELRWRPKKLKGDTFFDSEEKYNPDRSYQKEWYWWLMINEDSWKFKILWKNYYFSFLWKDFRSTTFLIRVYWSKDKI